tara:strand:- start:2174 stop:2926 length:753 start_codon:yes stop_codon:yes gene_type:complete
MNLKQKLSSNKLTIGSWISLGHPSIAEIMTKSNFDWLTIDLEHSVISLAEVENLIRVIELSGISPLVRLTENSTSQIKKVMDSGAHGIIVPMVNSLKDAETAIEAAYYPPKGKRSFGLARAQGFGTKFKEHIKYNQENTIVIVQIEHVDALQELEEILSLPQVDAYMIGPYDLSGSMGIPGDIENKEYLEVIKQINAVGKKMQKPSGIHIVEPNLKLLKKASEEYAFVAYSVDFRMIEDSCKKALKQINR